MNLSDSRYSRFALVREMMDTVGVVNDFDPHCTSYRKQILIPGKLILGNKNLWTHNFSRCYISCR